LEHPAGSDLFDYCGCGTESKPDKWGGWTLNVDQFHWGHRAAKPTRLYIVGCDKANIPEIPFREGSPTHCISQGHGVRIGHPLFKSRVPQWEREATPPAFAQWLIDLASRCSVPHFPGATEATATAGTDATPSENGISGGNS